MSMSKLFEKNIVGASLSPKGLKRLETTPLKRKNPSKQEKKSLTPVNSNRKKKSKSNRISKDLMHYRQQSLKDLWESKQQKEF